MLLCHREGNAFWPFKKKKKEDKKENLTPSEAVKNKKQTAHGLMTIHKVEGKGMWSSRLPVLAVRCCLLFY